MRLFHGTTLENYKLILENGFSPENPVWYASESDYMYFYNPENFIKLGESDDTEDAVNRAIENAFYNAQVTAAIQKSKEDKIIVIEVNVNKKHIEKDDSCPNMDLACKVSTDHLSIKNIVAAYESDFCHNMSLVYLTGIIDNDLINLDDFSSIELEIIRNLKDSNFYLENEIEWREAEI